ncbi:MAG: YncE family protein [Muribaculaceae bacterium]
MRAKSHILMMIIATAVAMALNSCREDDVIFIPEEVQVSNPEFSEVGGFYLLNEGNMGSNKCTLDYYDFSTGIYTRNIYGNANPNVPKELGDVGNDLKVYGNRLYAVINCSNKVEVMDKSTAKRIGQVDIPNCRYIAFHKGYAYVTSYAGPVVIDPDYEQLGYVAKVDTASLQVVAQCLVGYQPDDIEIVEDKIYVANSGGYRVPNYERTVSVIDIETFKVEETIDVDINLSRLVADKHGGLWIATRGDYYQVESSLYCYDVRKRRIVKHLDVPVSNMCIEGDSIYVVSSAWSNVTMSNRVTFAVIDVTKQEAVSDNFITDGTEAEIKAPYGVSVNPISRDIYLTDARNMVNPGYLHCYDRTGVRKWSVRTGDVPAHIAFLGENKNNN